jgi:hypothetical protein
MIFEKVYYKHKYLMHFDPFRKSFLYRSWDRISREPHLQLTGLWRLVPYVTRPTSAARP